jgi:hypothetical protein
MAPLIFFAGNCYRMWLMRMTLTIVPQTAGDVTPMTCSIRARLCGPSGVACSSPTMFKSASLEDGLPHADLVRDCGGDQISGDRDRKLQQASGGQADMGLGSPNCENTIEAFSMMGYGLRVAIISAQARATAESGDGAPGIVAHPPFSTNVPRSQA